MAYLASEVGNLVVACLDSLPGGTVLPVAQQHPQNHLACCAVRGPPRI